MYARPMMLIVLGTVAITAIFVASIACQRQDSSDALVGSGDGSYHTAAGEFYRIKWAFNENDAIRAIVIYHLAKKDGAFKDDVKLIAAYPASTERSGLWINGKKHRLSRQGSLFFVSDTVNVREMAIPAEFRALHRQPPAIDDVREYVERIVQLSPAPLN